MLQDNMDISRLMVYDQQIEEEKSQNKNMEVKWARIGDENFSNLRSYGQGLTKFKPRFFNQGSSSAPPRVNNDRVSNPKPQGGNSSSSYVARLLENVVENMMTSALLSWMGAMVVNRQATRWEIVLFSRLT